jgi:hypothetical protein
VCGIDACHVHDRFLGRAERWNVSDDGVILDDNDAIAQAKYFW